VSDTGSGGLFTLEPLIEAVREGVEEFGWGLSGLQKTTSHQFEGRWEGDSTRSAYLFFHPPDGPDFAGIDVYLDETSRGLTGNIALVVDLAPFGALGDGREALRDLGALSARGLGQQTRRPVTLRVRLEDALGDVDAAEAEVRFKLRLTRRAVEDGPAAVRALIGDAMRGFATILASPELVRFTGPT
jgi:hypothetical protein